MAEATAVLDLLLTARYVGGPAFGAMAGDVDRLVAKTSGLQKFGAAFNLLGTAAIVGGAGMAFALGAAAKAAGDYDKALNRLVSTHAIASNQVGLFSDLFQSVAEQYGQSATGIAEGSYLVLSGVQALGYTATDVFNSKLIPALAAYAVASGNGLVGSVTFNEAAQDLVHTLAGMHEPLSNWSNDLGLLNLVENKTALTQQQLTASLIRFAPTASALGMSFSSSLATVGALAESGLVGSRAGTELGSGLRHMITTSTGQNELKRLGIDPNSLFNQQGQLLDTGSLLGAVLPKLSGMTTADKYTAMSSLFGAVGGRAFDQLAQTGTVYQNLYGGMGGKGAGTTSLFSTAGGMMQTFNGHLAQLKASFQNLGITVGNRTLPIIDSWVVKLKPLVDSLNAFVKAHPEAIVNAFKAVPALIGGGLGLKMAGGVLGFLGGPVGKDATRGGMLGKGVGSLFGGLFAGGGGVAGAVAHRLGQAFGPFENDPLAGGKLTEKVSAGAFGMVSKHFPEAGARFALGGGAGDVLGGVGKDIGGGIGGMFGTMAGGVSKLLTGIPSLVGMLPGLIGGFAAVAAPVLLIAGAIAIVVLVFTSFRKEAEHAIGVIGKGLAPIFTFFGAIVQTAMKTVGDAWNRAWPSIHDAMEGLLKNLPKITPLLQVLGAVLAFVGTVVVGVAVGIITGFINMLAPIINVISGIISLVGSFFLILKGIFTLNGDEIKQGFSDAWEAIKQIVGNALLAIWNGITGVFGGIANFFGGVWDAITGQHKSGTEKAHKVIKQHLDTVTTESHTSYTNMATDTNSILSGMLTDSGNTLGDLATQGCGSFNDLQQCATNHLTQTEVIAKQKTQAIRLAVVNNLPTPADSFPVGDTTGQALMDGLTEGIKTRKQATIDAVSRAAFEVNQAFKDRLRISSPSQVFMEHGQNMMAGLVLGITGGAGGVHAALGGVGVGDALSSHLGTRSPMVSALNRLSDAMEQGGPEQHQSRGDWTAEAADIRERRMRYQDAHRALTYGAVGDTLGLSYRFSCQKTA
jgi:TP901 family phage tail tape measure protein